MKRLAILFAVLGNSCVTATELPAAPGLTVREIRLENNELIPQSVLDAMLPSYSNRVVTAEQLQELAERLTMYVVDQGYVSSGVIVPDQKIDGGIVHLRVVPGRIASTVIIGDGRLRDSYIIDRLGDLQSKPLNVGKLAERLQLLQQDPRIARMDATVKPGLERGNAVLNLSVEERRPYGVSLTADNHLSPNVGDRQLTAEFHHLNLLGFGDAMQLSYSHAEGFNGGIVSYSLPSGGSTLVNTFFEHGESRIVTQPFAALSIEGDTTRYGVDLRHAWSATAHGGLTLGIGLEMQQVRSYLLGEPFSFSTSGDDGVSKATLVNFSQEWVNREPLHVLALRSTFSAGVDALDASIGGTADSQFLYWLGQAQWLRKIALWGSTLDCQIQLRLSNDALPAYRKYALGGADSVRGYRESLIVRDNGVRMSVEWSTPVAYWRLPALSSGPGDGELRIAPFLDYGYGRDDASTMSDAVDIASAGVALRWQLASNSHVELQLAHALIERDPASLDAVLQDDGVHFSARVSW